MKMVKTLILSLTLIDCALGLAQDRCDSLFAIWQKDKSSDSSMVAPYEPEITNQDSVISKLKLDLHFDIEGDVWVWLLVSSDGHVDCQRVLKGTHPILDSLALNAVSVAQFKPFRDRYGDIMLPVTFPLKFKLQ